MAMPMAKVATLPSGWRVVKFKQMFDRLTRKNAEGNSNVLTISAQYGLINQEEFFNKFVASEDLSGYYLLRRGDFAYNKSYSVGYNFGAFKQLTRYDSGVVSPLYICFTPSASNKCPEFYVQFFESMLLDREIKAFAQEGARNHGLLNIAVHDFFSMPIPVPPLPEQRAIVEILTTQDRLIATKQRLIVKLQDFKKVLLKKIFPKNGEDKPEIRFAGFTNAWEQRKFFDNIRNTVDFRGRTPRKLGLDWSEEGYLALSALNVKDGYIDPAADAHFGNQELYDKWMIGCELREGQVLFTTEAPMGNVAQVPDNQRYILSQRTIAFDVEPGKITDDFLAVLLRSPNIFKELTALSSGGTAKGVSQKSMSHLNVMVPKNLREQTQIALFFKAINHLITLHQRELEQQKLVKKYLMQQLLTGKKRVKKAIAV
jgi:type I restriction enzyme S subunit